MTFTEHEPCFFACWKAGKESPNMLSQFKSIDDLKQKEQKNAFDLHETAFVLHLNMAWILFLGRR